MNIDNLKNKNIHFVECENWNDAYGYEKSQMKEDTINYIEQLQIENNQLRLINKEHQQINGELRQDNKLLNEQYIRLYKEYEQVKDNWNKLREIAKSQSGFKKQADLKGGLWFEIDELLGKMQELELGK